MNKTLVGLRGILLFVLVLTVLGGGQVATVFGQDGNDPNGKPATVRVQDFGAKGDGVTDDTEAIQKAVRYCFDNKASVLQFESNKVYKLDSERSQNSIVLYGSNLSVEGSGATLLKTASRGGFWGDVLDVCGLMDGYIYPGMGKYSGGSIPAENITVRNLIIKHSTQPKSMNSIGIINVNNVLLENVTCIDSPQTAFAVVSDAKDRPVDKVILRNCHAINSGYHAYRVSLQKTADTLNVLLENCSSEGIRNAEVNFKEAVGDKAHLWYRAATKSPSVSLRVQGCKFDGSGAILTTQGARNLVIQDSTIDGGVLLKGGRSDDQGFLMKGNRVNPGKPIRDLRRRVK